MWRGGTNGVGRIPRSAAELGAPDLMPRIRMCALLKGLPGVDARLYQVVNAEDPEPAIECLSRAGLMGDRVAEMSWLDRKLAIDIVGFSIAWQNLFVRLLFGCCVLKVASPAGSASGTTTGSCPTSIACR